MSEVSVGPSEAAAPEPGFLATLANVYIAPAAAFRSIAASPRWGAPLALAIAIGLAFSAVWISKADAPTFVRAQLEESGAINMVQPYQQERLVQAQAKWFKAFAWVGPLLIAPLGYGALAALLLVLYRFFYAAPATYTQSLAVVAWSFAAFHLLVDPLILLVMSLKNEWSVDPSSVLHASAAALMEKPSSPGPLHALASSLDLFSLWLMALLAIGFGAVIRKPAAVAAWGVLVPWLLYVAGKVLLAAVLQ